MTAEKRTFEEILDQLEVVVRELEDGSLPLEQALDRFEKGVRLSREGSKRLNEIEKRIEEVLADGSTTELHSVD